MSKKRLRKIQVAGEVYLWRREHQHLVQYTHAKCAENVVIYLQDYKKSPLRLSFREEDNWGLMSDPDKEKWCVGYPDDGVVWLLKYKPPLPNNAPYPAEERQTELVNLNRPAVIAKLIDHFIHNGWVPKENTKPLIVPDALKLLHIVDLPKGMG